MKSAAQAAIEAATSVNRAALQDFINELHGIPAKAMAMQAINTECPSEPIRGYECGTVMCLGGLYRELYTEWDDRRGLEDISRAMALHFGLNRDDVAAMLIMNDSYHLPEWVGYDFYKFDSKVDPEQRKQCMIRVLETAMETGRPSWTVALVETLDAATAEELRERRSYTPVHATYVQENSEVPLQTDV